MSQCLIPVLYQAPWEQEHFASLGYMGKATDLYRMSDSLFVTAHTNFSCQISACIFRYWENGQLFLKCSTHVAVRALLKISLSICQSKGGECSKPMGFLEMPGSIWFLVSGEEKPSSVSYFCLGHCFVSSDIASLFFFFILSVWSWKCWRKYYALVVLFVWYDQGLLSS